MVHQGTIGEGLLAACEFYGINHKEFIETQEALVRIVAKVDIERDRTVILERLIRLSQALNLAPRWLYSSFSCWLLVCVGSVVILSSLSLRSGGCSG